MSSELSNENKKQSMSSELSNENSELSVYNLASHTILTEIYNSRVHILEIMKQNGYNIERYEGFSMNEINIMAINKQMDMILESSVSVPSSKIYIKYYLDTLNVKIINTFVEELFELSDTLHAENDILYIISKSVSTDLLLNELKMIWNNKKIFVVIENIKQLQFNTLKHCLNPSVSILSNTESKELTKKYNYEHLPSISRFDPLARAICLRPGQIVKIMRSSETAILTLYYRKCIEN